jgi:hypothetical protein
MTSGGRRRIGRNDHGEWGMMQDGTRSSVVGCAEKDEKRNGRRREAQVSNDVIALWNGFGDSLFDSIHSRCDMIVSLSDKRRI